MLRTISISILAVALTACSAPQRQKPVFPEPDITTKQVYDRAQTNDVSPVNSVLRRPATEQEANIDPYMLHNTPRTDFRTLDNPTMYLFVREHIATKYRVPVPAYVTEFKLLERDEYALPGESNLTNWEVK